MKNALLACASFALALTAACVPVATPTPPSYVLHVIVTDSATSQPLPGALVRTDATPDAVSGPTGPDGGISWVQTHASFNVCASGDNWTTQSCAPVAAAVTQTVMLTVTPPPPAPTAPPVPQGPRTWTKTQLLDIQGDLMIFDPSIGCDSAETGIHCDTAGLQAGYIWLLTAPWYPADKRAQMYADVKAKGWTHFPVQIAQCVEDGGYDGLYPITNCAAHVAAINATLHELHAQNLIPKCTGISSTVDADPGIDTGYCPLGMDDWDDTDQKDCNLNALARNLPNALLIIEMPDHAFTPKQDACSPSPFPVEVNKWIAAAVQRIPNFSGVGFEINYDQGFESNVDQLTQLNASWRDLLQFDEEDETYWQLHDNAISWSDAIDFNDRVMQAAPWLHGYMGGASSHPPPVDITSDGHYLGTLDALTVQVVEAPDWRAWPQTTTLSRVSLDTDNVRVTFSKQGGAGAWPDVSFGVQYSIGLCGNLSGTWYCDAPIELWTGKDGSGGEIQKQNVDGSGRGQVAVNWFYQSRWGALQGWQPKPGETIGVFVVAGDARNAVSPIAERSNIVLITLPPDGVAATFTAQ